MDYSTLIQDFVDGALEQGKEEELFHALSGNEELRTDLKHELAIKDSIRNDTKAYTPSVESTKRIFATVGFNLPPAAVNLPVPVPSKTGLMQILSKFKQGILSSLVGAGITAAILLMLTPDTPQNININGSGEVSSQNLTKTVENNSPIAVTSSHETASKPQVITRTVYKPVYVYLPAEKNEDVVNSNSLLKENNTNDNFIIKNKSPLQLTNAMGFSRNNLSDNSMNGFSTFPIIPNIYNSYSFSENAEKLGLDLEVHGSQNWFTHSPTIYPRQNALFNNNSLGIYYNLSKAFSFGLELRQENFYQIYEGTDSIGNRYRYEQQPNFTSYALGLKFKPIIIFENFYPSIQMKIGGNNAGLVGRGALGLEYNPFASVSFLINAEYSILRFQHQGGTFWSPKYGLNYGLSFKF